MPAIWRSLAATSSRRCRQIVPVSRNVVPELLLWRQQRDDVAAGNGVSRQRRDDVAVQPGWLPSREPGLRNLRIIATRAPRTPQRADDGGRRAGRSGVQAERHQEVAVLGGAVWAWLAGEQGGLAWLGERDAGDVAVHRGQAVEHVVRVERDRQVIAEVPR